MGGGGRVCAYCLRHVPLCMEGCMEASTTRICPTAMQHHHHHRHLLTATFCWWCGAPPAPALALCLRRWCFCGGGGAQGPVLAFIYAVRELMNACGEAPAGGSVGSASGGGKAGGLPVNIAFVFEGEEENGSRGFRQAIMQNLRWLAGGWLGGLGGWVGGG